MENGDRWDRFPTGLIDTIYGLVVSAVGADAIPERQAFGTSQDRFGNGEELKVDVRLADSGRIALFGGGWSAEERNASAIAAEIVKRVAELRRMQDDLETRLNKDAAYLRRLAQETGNLFKLVELRFVSHEVTLPIRPRQLWLEADILLGRIGSVESMTVEARSLAQLRNEVRHRATGSYGFVLSDWNAAVRRCRMDAPETVGVDVLLVAGAA